MQIFLGHTQLSPNFDRSMPTTKDRTDAGILSVAVDILAQCTPRFSCLQNKNRDRYTFSKWCNTCSSLICIPNMATTWLTIYATGRKGKHQKSRARNTCTFFFTLFDLQPMNPFMHKRNFSARKKKTIDCYSSPSYFFPQMVIRILPISTKTHPANLYTHFSYINFLSSSFFWHSVIILSFSKSNFGEKKSNGQRLELSLVFLLCQCILVYNWYYT